MMCEASEKFSSGCIQVVHENMKDLRVIKHVPKDGEDKDLSTYFLDLAANNDVDGFRNATEGHFMNVDMVGAWYIRCIGSNRMALEQRTPIMIAALYGSLDVLRYILNVYLANGGDINKPCGSDGSTALHCGAAGGSIFAVETVKLLLDSGADVNALDAQGRRPSEVVSISPRLAHLKPILKGMLEGVDPMSSAFTNDGDNCFLPSSFEELVLLEAINREYASSSSMLSTKSGGSAPSSLSTLSPSSSPPKSPDAASTKLFPDGGGKSRDFLVDPSFPDIKNSVYATDEFRMFSFKVCPCSRAYSHDWTECPFVHPGENARRRDPRKYHYSCVPCPDFRKGACCWGDTCEYAHGVFECWLHPAQYRTRLCKDGTACARRVCFFAHTTEQLRPLYVTTGSSIASPRSSALDLAPMSPVFPSGSSSSAYTFSGVTLPVSPSPASPSSPAGTWSQQNVPTLHLPGASMHPSRLRAALNARDLFCYDENEQTDIWGEFACLPSQPLSTETWHSAAVAASTPTSDRAAKYRSLGLAMASTNFDDLLASELISSPRLKESNLLTELEAEMQAQKQVDMRSQLQHQVQAQMSLPMFPRQIQPQLNPQIHGSMIGVQSEAQNRMPSSLDLFSQMAALEELAEFVRQSTTSDPLLPGDVWAAFAQGRRLSSRDLAVSSAMSNWGSPTGKPVWSMLGDEDSKIQKLASFGVRFSEEPDLSWVHKLVREGSLESEGASDLNACATMVQGVDRQTDGSDLTTLGAWIDTLHCDDQLVA